MTSETTFSEFGQLTETMWRALRFLAERPQPGWIRSERLLRAAQVAPATPQRLAENGLAEVREAISEYPVLDALRVSDDRWRGENKPWAVEIRATAAGCAKARHPYICLLRGLKNRSVPINRIGDLDGLGGFGIREVVEETDALGLTEMHNDGGVVPAAMWQLSPLPRYLRIRATLRGKTYVPGRA